MNTEQVMELLNYNCRNEQIYFIKELLQKYPNEVDLLHDNGVSIRAAMRHENPEVLNILLTFYKKTQIDGKEGMEKEIALIPLKGVLRDGCDEGFVSDAIAKVLREYIKLDDETPDDEQDLTNIVIPEMRDWEDDEESMDQSSTAAGSLTYRELHSSDESINVSKVSSNEEEREVVGYHPDLSHEYFP